MQRASILCSSNSILPVPAGALSSRGLAIPCRSRPNHTLSRSYSSSSSSPSLSFTRFQTHSPLHSTATQEHEETDNNTVSGFVEVGYISKVHGIQGEARVKPNTDFPELRFGEPGRRWLKQQVLGRATIREVELEEGRGHPGQKSWILKFKGVDTIEQAKQLIGSTLLVREEERPELGKGEFYTRDLVGMRVFLQETGEAVGTVVNVFDSGGNDLLQVELDSSLDIVDSTGKQKPDGVNMSDHLVWVPFVEAIVPIVDTEKREMHIKPPKGLLEVNLRFEERSKKERRLLEWKDRKKNQKRLIAAKKKLIELEQKHVFDGLRFGEKAQRSLLADQILEVNSKLLQYALKDTEMPSKRWSRTKLVNAIDNEVLRNVVVAEECLSCNAGKEKLGKYFPLQEKGLELVSRGKVAIVLVLNDGSAQGATRDNDVSVSFGTKDSMISLLETSLSGDQRFMKTEERASVHLIIVCAAHELEPLKTLFQENDYFSFDAGKVQFLEEVKLPVIRNSPEEPKKYKIVMKSPWEILQSPVGSGGTFSVLSSDYEILNNLIKQGVKYIEIMSSSHRHVGLNLPLLGLVELSESDIGVQFHRDPKDFEEGFNMVFAMSIMKKLTNQTEKLHFDATPKLSSYVELVEKDWVDIVPTTPNSYELSCSIYSSLGACSYENMCVMEIEE